MTPHEEAVFEAKAEKQFASHRELKDKRNFMMWNRSYDSDAENKYRKNFDATFPNAPGQGF